MLSHKLINPSRRSRNDFRELRKATDISKITIPPCRSAVPCSTFVPQTSAMMLVHYLMGPAHPKITQNYNKSYKMLSPFNDPEKQTQQFRKKKKQTRSRWTIESINFVILKIHHNATQQAETSQRHRSWGSLRKFNTAKQLDDEKKTRWKHFCHKIAKSKCT